MNYMKCCLVDYLQFNAVKFPICIVSSFCGMFCKGTAISGAHSPTLSPSVSLLPLYFSILSLF